MASSSMFYFTKVMSDLFLHQSDDNEITFETLTNIEEFWRVC
jgi:hypothetical protein